MGGSLKNSNVKIGSHWSNKSPIVLLTFSCKFSIGYWGMRSLLFWMWLQFCPTSFRRIHLHLRFGKPLSDSCAEPSKQSALFSYSKLLQFKIAKNKHRLANFSSICNTYRARNNLSNRRFSFYPETLQIAKRCIF